MSSGVFLIQDSGGLIEMRESAYDSEALLQGLLSDYPSLLAGDQMNSEVPRRWLLVAREMAVPGEQDGVSRWALDHLFLDQDGTPTLVEVKRSTDTRIRREVVGQMLDYAANAVAYWPVEKIRAQFEANSERGESNAQERLAALLENDTDPETFWLIVKTNLQAGRIRMVFVADIIPPELQRIIEFLNSQMTSAEVLGIAIPQFQGQGQRLFVPRVVGLTATAQQQKKSSGGQETRQWDETSFFANLAEKKTDKDVQVARAIYEWAKKNSDRLSWGRGKQSGSFSPVWIKNGIEHYPFALYTSGTIEIQFITMMSRAPFEAEDVRLQLLHKLNEAVSMSLPNDAISRRPSVPLSRLADETIRARFLAFMDHVVAMIKS